MVSILCVRLPAAFCIWYQKVVLQGVPGMIIRYHFIMPCLPISAGTPKSTVSISFPIVLIGIKKHTLEGWVGLSIAKLLERNKVKRLSLFGSFLAFEKRTPPIWEGGIFKQPLYFSLLLLLPHLVLYLDAGL